jgi:hypothetical protein
MSDMLERFHRKRRYCRSLGKPFELTFEQFCEIAETGGPGSVMVEVVPSSGYVSGVQMIPRSQIFRRYMDVHYRGERGYLPQCPVGAGRGDLQYEKSLRSLS